MGSCEERVGGRYFGGFGKVLERVGKSCGEVIIRKGERIFVGMEKM